MATILTHAIAAAAAGRACAPTRPAWPVLALAAACAMVPDLDVVAFRLGIPYGAMLGHRGFTHSLLFAALLGVAVTACAPRRWLGDARKRSVAIGLALATASHGLLDACTEGGLGVAFLAPFSARRFLFPLRPIAASPIGRAFLGRDGLAVLIEEALVVWLPALALVAARAAAERRQRSPEPRPGAPEPDGERVAEVADRVA